MPREKKPPKVRKPISGAGRTPCKPSTKKYRILALGAAMGSFEKWLLTKK